MAGIAVIGTMTLGTDGPPGAIMQGVGNVICEGRAAATVGSIITPHKKYGAKVPHPRTVATGAPNVLINGIPAAITGGTASCGDIIGPGCATVTIG